MALIETYNSGFEEQNTPEPVFKRLIVCLVCGAHVQVHHATTEFCFSEHTCDGKKQNKQEISKCIGILNDVLVSWNASHTTPPPPPSLPPPAPPPLPPQLFLPMPTLKEPKKRNTQNNPDLVNDLKNYFKYGFLILFPSNVFSVHYYFLFSERKPARQMKCQRHLQSRKYRKQNVQIWKKL